MSVSQIPPTLPGDLTQLSPGAWGWRWGLVVSHLAKLCLTINFLHLFYVGDLWSRNKAGNPFPYAAPERQKGARKINRNYKQDSGGNACLTQIAFHQKYTQCSSREYVQAKLVMKSALRRPAFFQPIHHDEEPRIAVFLSGKLKIDITHDLTVFPFPLKDFPLLF